jgi:hypothetical protein
MKRHASLLAEAIVVGMALAFSHTAFAALELTTPEGRRVVLYENGTWRYAETSTDAPAADSKSKEGGEAVLSLEKKTESGNNCRFDVRLVNNYPYEIKSFIPFYSAYRENGVRYDTVTAAQGFTLLKPGDEQERSFMFRGIPCHEIARVQVTGGDRCDMGDLDRWSAAKGQCLARVRVTASDLVRFEK